MSTRPAFVVDVNKCTGCDACSMACQIANGLPAGRQWREVRTFNELHVPDVELLHLSMACNHCHDAPCLAQCPARAYSRDPRTDAVLIDADACLGCRYCAWACPYGAPRFDEKNGVMTKCTFCHDKLLDGGRPACVTSCPTGALDWRQLTDADLTQDLPGFRQAHTDPSLQVVGLHPERRVPQQTAPPVLPPWQRLWDRLTPHITLAHEWPLAGFTLLTAVLVGAFAAAQRGGPRPDGWIFAGAGLAGMALSASHLGRRARAWRAALHPDASWLSREVILFGLFLAAAAAVLLEAPIPAGSGPVVAGLGVVVLFVVDRVYHVTRIRGGGILHSAQVLGTGLLLAAAWSRADLVLVTVAVVKVVLYVVRQVQRARLDCAAPLGLTVPRLGFLAAGVGSLIWSGSTAAPATAVALLLAAELIDRGLYYHELDIVTPESEMLDALARRPAAQGVFEESRGE